MKINSINNFKIQRQFLNNNKSNQPEAPIESESQEIKSLGYTDLMFKAASTTLVKPNFRTEAQQKIANKISTYLKIMPAKSKLASPIKMNAGNKVIEFIMDKTDPTGLTNVSVKMFEDNGYSTILNMTIDKKGQVKSGAYHEPGGPSTTFDRGVNRMRRMQYGNATYRAVGDNDTLWTRISPHANETFSPYAASRMEFNDTELQEMLSEMAKKSTSFLAK